MKPLKIAIFTPSFLPKCSGAEIFHHNLASRLVGAGHEVSVIVPRRIVRQLQRRKLPYRLIGFPSLPWKLLKRWPALGLWVSRLKLSAIQRRNRFDVWHTVVTYPTGVAFIDWQTRTGVPGLLRSVGDDLSSASNEVGLRRLDKVDQFVRRFIPRVQAAVALSEQMAADYRMLGLAEARIHMFPNAVDLERFQRPIDRAAIRASYGIGPETFLFLSVGRNHPQKDFPTLLRACALLKQRASFALIIAGRGSSELQALVEELGLSGVVHLTKANASDSLELPPQPLVELYRAADAFVMSSVLEGFSSALLEAMAAALPAIVTEAPGIVDFVRGGKDALTVPVSAPEHLAAAMDQVIKEQQFRADLSERSLQRAQAFSWDKVVAAYLELYGELIRERSGKF